MSRYHKPLRNLKGVSIKIDVYDVLETFQVHCPATAHAIKKALCAGGRGAKSTIQDLEEAIESLDRAIILQRLREQAPLPAPAPPPASDE